MSYISRFKRRHKWIATAISVAIFVFVLGQQQGWWGSAAQTVEQAAPGQYQIDHFVDGDTIAVKMQGKVETIRFVGVDTPETHKPNTPVQCYGPAAAAFTKNTIGTQSVRLVSDSLSTDRDRYNRLLRYVYLPDGTLLNELLIQKGYGFYYPYFPFSKSTRFKADEDTAIAQKVGLWANCQPIPKDQGGYESNPQ
jgi:micrococcal nuclease